MIKSRLAYLVFLLGFSMTASAEKSVSAYKEFTAYVADSISCTSTISVTIKSASADNFSVKKNNLSKLVAGLGNSLANSCSTLKAIKITGQSDDQKIYSGIAAIGSDWELVDELTTNIFSASKVKNDNPATIASATDPTSNAKQADAFAIFETAAPRKEPKTTPQKSPQKNGSPTPTASRESTSKSAKTISVYCNGKGQQYTGPLPTFSSTFEFRTVLDYTKKKHQVVNVMSGKLFQSGMTYNMLELPNDMLVLNAESSDSKWIIKTLRLDLAVGKLSGQGTVNLSSLRSRIMPRLRKNLPSLGGKEIPEGGYDDARRVEITGSCIRA